MVGIESSSGTTPGTSLFAPSTTITLGGTELFGEGGGDTSTVSSCVEAEHTELPCGK
eukprot:CAMPEP_0197742262 /NCGR_PEP_ID=MMETSP1435-20131217/30811_1 /TAXON_ID=426625 /ORGANISM="Chaetoceros brevis, Strain CCMP164" /LENGTH=56 /DNA_ID=CAMNT_0043332723 /DNA_START=389 /DNA_END=559 /DNA_ORIENTATION=+